MNKLKLFSLFLIMPLAGCEYMIFKATDGFGMAPETSKYGVPVPQYDDPGHSVGMSEKELANEKFLQIAEAEGRKPPPMVQSSAEACPGWAMVHFALKYPVVKAAEIIEKQTIEKASWLDYSLDGETMEANKVIHQTCDHPNPSQNYRKLGWTCPAGDPECDQKSAFVREYDALQNIGDQELGFQKFKELLQRFKNKSI